MSKRPVAAGRGAGNFRFCDQAGPSRTLYPALPDEKHRSGYRHAEVGRATVHVEGVALLEQWIKEMKSR
ncbi:MAG: hypothetical protein IPL18_14060 [Sphingomonadales bacterium]|nr:hypothetical protein [Sphingomonadales bacterium]